MTREPDIEGLRDFFYEGDKNSPRFFAGRQELISAIEETVDRLRKQIDQLPISDVHSKQGTWLIQGAPGAGKTTLQWYLRDRWLADKDGPVVVEGVLGEVPDRHLLTTDIANAVLPKGADLLMTSRTVARSVGVETKVTFGRTTSDSVQRGSLTLTDLRKLYHSPRFPWLRRFLLFGHRKTTKPRPIVLMLDEIQSMEPEADKLIRDLHAGIRGVPIILLLAGLAWSRERLKEAGVSRFATGNISHVQTLEPLQLEEAAESVKLMLKEHHVTGNETEDIASWIAGLSDGWPQHLHHYMRALAGELAAKGGNLSEVNRDLIQADGDAKRRAYYFDRLQSSLVGTHTRLLAQVASTIGIDGCHYDELVRMLRNKLWQEELDHSEVMPEGMRPQGFIQEMIRSGLIHRVVDEITIPIPSFMQYLLERPNKKLHTYLK